jgi:predicted TIM-barrel fold metal-dependent hydrolase
MVRGDKMNILDVNTCFGFYPYKNIDASAERLKGVMQKHNIAKACTMSMRGIFYDHKEGNEETLEVCKTEEAFIPVAAFNPKNSSDWEKDIESIYRQGFKIVRFFPEFQGWDVGQTVFLKTLKALDQFGLPLIINDVSTQLLKAVQGTKIPVILLGSHYYKLSETIAVLAECPNFYVEARYLVSPDAIELFIEKLGAKRLLYGSNAPLDYAGSSIERIINAEISDKDRELIFGRNLECILQGAEGACK